MKRGTAGIGVRLVDDIQLVDILVKERVRLGLPRIRE